MEERTCSTLVNAKPCNLKLMCVGQELETGTVIYECALGHRTYIPANKVEVRKCPTLVGGKRCDRTLSRAAQEDETATAIYECPLGHRTYVPLEPDRSLLEEE